MKQQKWEKPELMVLARGRPEETVLNTCKNSSYYGGPMQSPCKYSDGLGDCETPTPS